MSLSPHEVMKLAMATPNDVYMFRGGDIKLPLKDWPGHLMSVLGVSQGYADQQVETSLASSQLVKQATK